MSFLYPDRVLRPVDIPVLLQLSLPGASEMSFQQLADALHLSTSEVHGSFQRARLSGLLVQHLPKTVNRSALLEFLQHGLRYSFPAERGDLARGVPTAHAAEPLRSMLQPDSDPPPVWPHASGTMRGYTFAPLYKRAAEAALEDPRLYQLFSLVDALRDGRVRERALAMEELRKRIA
jgi:hypothetical protein